MLVIEETEKHIAFSYEANENDWIIARHGNRGGPAGGAYTTPSDMYFFSQALLNHQIVSQASLNVLTSAKSSLSFGGKYGFGFIIEENNIGHGGMGPGFYFDFKIYQKEGYTFVLCLNNESGAGSELLFTLREILNQ